MGMSCAAKSAKPQATPDDWRVFSLQELATLERGKFSARPRNDPRYFDGPYPFIQTGDITNSQGTVSSFSQTLNEDGLRVSRLFPPNTLFFTIAANIGDVAIAPFATACPDSLIAISPTSRADQRWLFYALGSRKRIFESLATQNAQLNINLEKLRPYEMAVPPLPEQKAIATALSDVDALLGALDRLFAKKRDLKQAAMQQLLTGQTRLPGCTGKWETKRLGDLGALSKGRGIRKDDVLRDGLPCIRYGEIYTRHNDIVREFFSFISPEVASDSCRLHPGDIIFACSGETAEEIGKCVAFTSDQEAYVGGDTILLHPAGHSSTFLGYLLNLPAVAKQKARMGQGDAVVHISARNLAALRVTVPALPEQCAIAAVFTEMDAELSELSQRRDKTRLLKQGMMQELLTGRTRLV